MSFDEINLRRALANLESDLRTRLNSAGFHDDELVAFARSLTEGDAKSRRTKRNRVAGVVRVPESHEIPTAPVGESENAFRARGEEAMRAGQFAFCVMAGGMATRMGGVVKALVNVVREKTFLDLRLIENHVFSELAHRPIPFWLMTSDATDHAIRDALTHANAPAHVATFMQNLGLRLSTDGDLFVDAKGHPSTYATGHGDLPDALRRSGLLGEFVKSGGEYIAITNVDNLGATLDPAILGAFIATGKEVMVEVCAKVAGDKGGIPVRAEGKLQVVEEFRLPENFDAASVRVFNTNTFWVRAKALLSANYSSTYFEVEKTVDEKPAIQFERLLQELTANFDAAYIEVPREGVRSRFEPVKDNAELEKRRDAIEAILSSRSILK